MHIKENYKVRQIAGENLIIDQGQSHADMTKVISLNSTAMFLWSGLQGKEFTVEDVADMLVSRFAISREQALADANRWVDTLQKHGIVC